jgi:hypothetical protein
MDVEAFMTYAYAHELCAYYYSYLLSARGSSVVQTLGYKPEGRGFETRWGE